MTEEFKQWWLSQPEDVRKLLGNVSVAQAGFEAGMKVEREACALLCEGLSIRRRLITAAINGVPEQPCEFAAAIRQRGVA